MPSSIEPLEPRHHLATGSILFVRGADRSGGFLEAANDAQRTEQLADINNASTASGNHGWATLATKLRGEGYTVTQVKEPLEADAPATGQTTGAPLALQSMSLSQYDAIVMASNNAVYSKTQVDALDAYVNNGGGVLFISDGNFGSSWADSPTSDNAFLARYGMAFNQDNGQYTLSRSGGDFARPDEPILFGVDAFDGEGVSPIRLAATAPDGVTVRRVAGAKGTTYDNNPSSMANDSRGAARAVDSRDASLVLANAGVGRVAAFFDRNTFFNANGAGTDITKNDNARLASNLFEWVTDHESPAITTSGFSQGGVRRLTFRINDNLNGTLARSDIRLRSRRRGGGAIASHDWSLSIVDGDGYTDVSIAIRAAASGPYQLQIPRRSIADDSGNVRSGAIRYAFTVLPVAASVSMTKILKAVTWSRRAIDADILGVEDDPAKAANDS